jgi:Cellulase (glycosyl hydrolase family 5)
MARNSLMACVLVAGLAFPTPAPAQQRLVTGFSDPFHLQASSGSERAPWMDRTAATGAGIVRLLVEWPQIVESQPPDPTNPGSASYNPFFAIDGPVRDADARGLEVLLTINHAPSWAEGPGRPTWVAPGAWKPNPADLADFVQAIATRYSGSFDPDGAGPEPPLPAVQALQVWNEPNHGHWLSPQFEGTTALSPDYYREMLNASYEAIKAVNPRMRVVAGGTSPYGDPPGGPYPGEPRAYPVQFWQQLLCVHPVEQKIPVKSKKRIPAKSKKKKGKKWRRHVTYVRTQGCPGPALFDVFAHHPIDNTGGGPLKSGPSPDDVSTPDLGRLVSVLRGAEQAGTTLPGTHPVWVTEFWWDSNPPNPVGAPLDVQAAWLEQSLYLFWKAGADTAINFQVGDTTEHSDAHAGLQAGLYFLDGSPKPALTAFRFPFVTERINKRAVRAWGKAPEGGTLLIQRQQGADWVTIKELQVREGAVFLTKLRSSRKKRKKGKKRPRPYLAGALRATVGASQSLAWYQS